MSAASPFVEFAAGDLLLRQGEPARAMYILETGKVEVSRDGVVLAELGPGDILGEQAIVQDQPHGASAIARTAVRALELDQAAFHAVLRANPEVGLQVMRRLVRLIEASEARRVELERRLGPGTASAAADARPAAAPAAAPATPATPTATPAPAAEQKAAPVAQQRPHRPATATAPEAAARPAPAPAPARAPAPTPAAPAGPGLALRHGETRIALDPAREDWRVGRLDPATGQVPEVDLGALDVARSLSRRHARLRMEGGRLLLSEEPGVVNGTWINGQRLEAGQSLPVKAGDRLRFGAVEVEVVTA